MTSRPPTGSLWLDAHPEAGVADRLPEDDRFDEIVVGAGLTGLVTALLLARAGRRVGVLEAGRVGGLTTGHTTAKVSLLQGTKLSRMARSRPRSQVRDYLAGNREGLAWLRRFCEDHGVAVQERDAVTFAANDAEVRLARAEHDVAGQLGLPVRWVPELDTPFPSYGGTVLAEQLQLDPMDLVEALAAQVREHGGTIHPHLHVRDVDHGASAASVVLDDGRRLTAANVVLATGTPILDRGLSFAQLAASRSYLLAFVGATPPDPMYLSAGASTRSVRGAPGVPGQDGTVLLVGGNGHPVGRTGSERRHLDDLRAWAHGWCPDAVETHAWSAQDYAAPRGAMPLVGTLPLSGRRIHYATGYDKWGMTNAVAAAHVLSGVLLGTRPGWSRTWQPPALDPRSLPGLARLNAGVVVAALRSALTAYARSAPESVPADEGAVGRRGVVPVAVGDGCRLSAVCTHLGGTVRWNDAEQSWDCPLHGSRFDACGRVIEGPAVRPLAEVDGIDREEEG